MNILDDLTEVLADRKNLRAGESYVASLHQAGLNKILEKIGEEATEVIIAAKDAEMDPTQKEEVINILHEIEGQLNGNSKLKEEFKLVLKKKYNTYDCSLLEML